MFLTRERGGGWSICNCGFTVTLSHRRLAQCRLTWWQARWVWPARFTVQVLLLLLSQADQVQHRYLIREHVGRTEPSQILASRLCRGEGCLVCLKDIPDPCRICPGISLWVSWGGCPSCCRSACLIEWNESPSSRVTLFITMFGWREAVLSYWQWRGRPALNGHSCRLWYLSCPGREVYFWNKYGVGLQLAAVVCQGKVFGM